MYISLSIALQVLLSPPNLTYNSYNDNNDK